MCIFFLFVHVYNILLLGLVCEVDDADNDKEN